MVQQDFYSQHRSTDESEHIQQRLIGIDDGLLEETPSQEQAMNTLNTMKDASDMSSKGSRETVFFGWMVEYFRLRSRYPIETAAKLTDL